MKIFGAMAMIAVGTGLWAGDGGQATKRVVTACFNSGVNASMVLREQGTAVQILKQAGVQLKWRSDERTCTEGNGILVTVSNGTPLSQHPGALAFAKPFDRTQNIVLFYDRVLNAVSPNTVPALLGYVIAHEIIHMLQGVDLHADSGVMKARWTARDYSDMQCGRLKLSGDDIARVESGMEWRSLRASRVE